VNNYICPMAKMPKQTRAQHIQLFNNKPTECRCCLFSSQKSSEKLLGRASDIDFMLILSRSKHKAGEIQLSILIYFIDSRALIKITRRRIYSPARRAESSFGDGHKHCGQDIDLGYFMSRAFSCNKLEVMKHKAAHILDRSKARAPDLPRSFP
jgi:hypothetical protein